MKKDKKKKVNTKTEKFKRFDKGILVFNLLFILYFIVYFIMHKNWEFTIYTIFILFVIGLMVKLHKKYHFSRFVLIGVTILHVLHKMGRYIILNGKILYEAEVIEGFLRYDKILHFWGIFVFTLVGFYLLKPYIKTIEKKRVISLILFLFGMGIGTFWEMFEFSVVATQIRTGVGGYFNTMGDIYANAVGSVCAVLYLHLKGMFKKLV